MTSGKKYIMQRLWHGHKRRKFIQTPEITNSVVTIILLLVAKWQDSFTTHTSKTIVYSELLW